MKEKRSYTAKAVFSALGKSVLYLLFFLAMQLLVTLGYAIAAALRAVLAYGGADTAQGVQMFAESVLTGSPAITLIADLLAAFSLLLWFRLRHKRLSEAAGLCRCSMWTLGFCAFGAVGVFVLVSLVLSLLPERWMAEYNAVSLWQFSAVMLIVCAAGCFAFRRGLAGFAAETTKEESTDIMM